MVKEFRFEIAGIQELLRKLESGKRPEVIKRSLHQGALLIAGWSKDKRLTGPRPRYLGVVSNRLRSSIAASKTEQLGDVFTARIGTNVEYARAHELGFQGRVSVRSFVRHTRKGSHLVSSHFRNMDIKARPFLKPSIEDESNRQEVLNILVNNINEAMQRP